MRFLGIGNIFVVLVSELTFPALFTIQTKQFERKSKPTLVFIPIISITNRFEISTKCQTESGFHINSQLFQKNQ